MAGPVKQHLYWSAKHQCVVTAKTPPEVMRLQENWGRYMQCAFFSDTAEGRGWLWSPSDNLEYSLTYAHGRDLHPISELQALAIQADLKAAAETMPVSY